MPTHGSLTKAGKVRNQTPKLESSAKKKSSGPLRRNLRDYKRMISGRRNFGRRRGRRR